MNEIIGTQIEKKNKNEEEKNINELLNDYIIDKTLGKGNFGKVKLGIHKITKEKVSKFINYIFI